jgi:two-component system, OmpR family, heavy metal sensor histidine kinase CusS
LNLPIRTRLTAIYCIVFCLGAGTLETGAYAALKLAISAVADRSLQTRLAGVEEFLGEHFPRLGAPRLQNEIRMHIALQPNFLQIQVLGGQMGGQIMYEGPGMPADASLEVGTVPRTWTREGTSKTLRILSAQRIINGQLLRLSLGEDLTVPLEVVHHFGLLLLLSCPILIAASALVGHWTAGRALSPVLAITNAARAIDAPDLSRRIAVPPSRDELRYLAETLNGMLARIETAFRKTTELTANASHELRTPLAVIRATAEVALMRAPGTDSDRAALREILREAERNTALLEDLLRLARADAGNASLHFGPVDFAETVRVTCGRCEPLAAAQGISLRLKPASGPLSVSGDAAHLRRLVLILLDNALKYTPAGGVVEVTVASAPSGYATCEVRDTGIGISEADLPHIFDRFFRSDRARTREQSGAGLGLAIAEWIARVHHSQIEVESVLGVGSTFRVSFPVLPKEQVPFDEMNDLRLIQSGKRA